MQCLTRFAAAGTLFTALSIAAVSTSGQFDKTLSTDQKILHALNRLTFGPRPGDLQKVESMGVDKWIELQLHPEKIDNSPLDARLAPFRTLKMDAKEMIESLGGKVADRRAS